MKKHFNFIIRAVDLLLPTACLIVAVVWGMAVLGRRSCREAGLALTASNASRRRFSSNEAIALSTLPLNSFNTFRSSCFRFMPSRSISHPLRLRGNRINTCVAFQAAI